MRAWIYFGIFFIDTIVSIVISIKLIPGLLNERGKIQEGTKTWDKVLLAVHFTSYLLGIPIIAGLDIGRFQWSQLNWNFFAIGLVIYIFTYIIILWAMAVNTHFEGTVRIQKDRDHKVISNGPYKFIRHPGYVGMILGSICIPLMMGSVYTFIPAGVCTITLIIRTALEDKTLHEELNGYSGYAKKVKFRLLPGIW